VAQIRPPATRRINLAQESLIKGRMHNSGRANAELGARAIQ
jgi:hypothetical protein